MPVLMLEKHRAAEAWTAVRLIGILPKAKARVKERYRSRVRSAPAMIQRNGLGQFLAFLAASGFEGGRLTAQESDRADGLLYQHLGRWLVIALKLRANPPGVSDEKAIVPGAGPALDPLDFLIDPATTLDQTIHATAEALAYLRWARRFAESQIEKSRAKGSG